MKQYSTRVGKLLDMTKCIYVDNAAVFLQIAPQAPRLRKSKAARSQSKVMMIIVMVLFAPFLPRPGLHSNLHLHVAADMQSLNVRGCRLYRSTITYLMFGFIRCISSQVSCNRLHPLVLTYALRRR
jgi:hypothetical protein